MIPAVAVTKALRINQSDLKLGNWIALCVFGARAGAVANVAYIFTTKFVDECTFASLRVATHPDDWPLFDICFGVGVWLNHF